MTWAGVRSSACRTAHARNYPIGTRTHPLSLSLQVTAEVSADVGARSATVHVLDIRHRLVAGSLTVGCVAAAAGAWGGLVVAAGGGGLVVMREVRGWLVVVVVRGWDDGDGGDEYWWCCLC